MGHWARMAGVQKTVGAVGLAFNMVTNVSSFSTVWLINIVSILHPFSPLSSQLKVKGLSPFLPLHLSINKMWKKKGRRKAMKEQKS